MTNVAPESAVADTGMVSNPRVAVSAQAIAPHEGVEAIGAGPKPEVAVEVITPPKTEALRDAGLASFSDPALVLERVHLPDDQKKVNATDKYPWSVNA